MFEIERFDDFFGRMTRPFQEFEDMWEEIRQSPNTQTFGPYYYGYSIKVGPDGKPVVKEWGNVRQNLLPTSENREPLIDTFVDEKEKLLKIVAEMPGIEKNDIKIEVVGNTVNIDAQRGERNYHTKVPIKQKFDENSVKATYNSGILELRFNLRDEEEDKPKGKTVKVE